MLEILARLGYACKALIYTIIGLLAIGAALRRGGRITDTSGALRVILVQPYGRTLLLVLAIGLCGYALWRILDAIRDPDHHGTQLRGIVTRIGNVVRAGIYGGLAIESLRLFRGLRGSSGPLVRWTTKRRPGFHPGGGGRTRGRPAPGRRPPRLAGTGRARASWPGRRRMTLRITRI